MPYSMWAKTRLSKRGTVNIPQHILEKARIEPASRVWIVSDGDILIIKRILRKNQNTYPPIIKHLHGAFKRLISR